MGTQSQLLNPTFSATPFFFDRAPDRAGYSGSSSQQQEGESWRAGNGTGVGVSLPLVAANSRPFLTIYYSHTQIREYPTICPRESVIITLESVSSIRATPRSLMSRIAGATSDEAISTNSHQ